MIETRNDHEYQARVWMQETLTKQLHREALARIEAMLPSGYRYRVQKTEQGWRGTMGGVDGSGWGIPHSFRTEAAAAVGLLALLMDGLMDGLVYPGCSTSFGRVRVEEQLRLTEERLEEMRQENARYAKVLAQATAALGGDGNEEKPNDANDE